jgi:protein-S-isoprenylcysteine O-methyltransferase Ste14
VRGALDSGRGYVAAQIAMLTALALEVRHARADAGRTFGALAVLIGGALMFGGASRLGDRLRALPAPAEDAVLRTDGAYARMRHPIYTGLLFFGGGFAVMSRRRRAAALWLALLLVLTRKAGIEEGMLLERFPEYEDYMVRTPRFVPRLLRRW